MRSERGKALRDILTLVDSTTITLPLSSHAWASYQHALGAVKAHMALEQAGDAIYPTQIILTNGKIADISIAKTRLTPRPDSILVADRGYEDKHLFRMNALQGMRFVIRAKNNTYYYPVGDVPRALSQGMGTNGPSPSSPICSTGQQPKSEKCTANAGGSKSSSAS